MAKVTMGSLIGLNRAGYEGEMLKKGDIHAGGPGSGCHGSNCGRPEGSGNKNKGGGKGRSSEKPDRRPWAGKFPHPQLDKQAPGQSGRRLNSEQRESLRFLKQEAAFSTQGKAFRSVIAALQNGDEKSARAAAESMKTKSSRMVAHDTIDSFFGKKQSYLDENGKPPQETRTASQMIDEQRQGKSAGDRLGYKYPETRTTSQMIDDNRQGKYPEDVRPQRGMPGDKGNPIDVNPGPHAAAHAKLTSNGFEHLGNGVYVKGDDSDPLRHRITVDKDGNWKQTDRGKAVGEGKFYGNDKPKKSDTDTLREIRREGKIRR